MSDKAGTQVVPGISLTETGEVTVDPELHDALLELAQLLEAPTDLPVDVQHVVAGIVLAVRDKKLNKETPLAANDPTLVTLLTEYVRTVFDDYGESLGTED